jgi:phage baseplate assembly protein V
MPFKSPELSTDHHLEGMVRCGRATKIKTDKSIAATVTYPDRGFQSGYLLVLQRNTIGHQDYYVPVPGEPVWVIMQGKSLNRGLILGSAYTEGSLPPFNSTTIRGMKFADGSYIIYDTAGGGNYQLNLAGKITATIKGDLVATVGGNLSATVTGSATLKAPTITLDAVDVYITGKLHLDHIKGYQLPWTQADARVQNLDGSGGSS